MRPYYERNGITIYHGDCREILPSIPNGEVEWVITDPPYNAGKAYGQHDDTMTDADYANWCRSWFNDCRRIARGVVIFPGHGNLPVWWDIERPGRVGCWHKPGNPAGGGLVQFCEWEPWLLWGHRMGGSDVIRATVTAQPEVGDYPCPKPLPLLKRLLLQAKASSVCDPFMGSGTTVVAAHHLGIRAIGIEVEERYCEIAAKRLAQGVLLVCQI